MELTKEEFDFLVKQKKQFKESDIIKLDKKWTREIVSMESKDTFLLDFSLGRIELSKFTYNKRFRKSIVLLRYDSHGIHTNPDGEVFSGSHVHIYRDGYGDKFAFKTDILGIDTSKDQKHTILGKILDYFNVENNPLIKATIF